MSRKRRRRTPGGVLCGKEGAHATSEALFDGRATPKPERKEEPEEEKSEVLPSFHSVPLCAHLRQKAGEWSGATVESQKRKGAAIRGTSHTKAASIGAIVHLRGLADSFSTWKLRTNLEQAGCKGTNFKGDSPNRRARISSHFGKSSSTWGTRTQNNRISLK